MVIFIKDGHQYFTKAEPRRRLQSPSSFIRKYKGEFDKDYWLSREALNRLLGKELIKESLKEVGAYRYPYKPDLRVVLSVVSDTLKEKSITREDIVRIREEVRDEWDWKNTNANFEGTKFHDKMERKFYRDKSGPNPLTGEMHPVPPRRKMEFDNEGPDDLSSLDPGIHPELLVYNLDWMLCGQLDYPVIEEGKHAHVFDWKTNDKDPEKEKGNSFSKMTGPLSHIPDNIFYSQALQLSSYAYMLESHGYTIGDLAVGWTPDYKEKEVRWIELPYLRQEVEDVIALEINS